MYQDLFKPSQIKELCHQAGLSPSKQFGQNYLINRGIIQKIIDAAKVSQQDTIVEVGPGFGVLTLGLAPLVNKVISFEIEKKLQTYWQDLQQQYPNVEIVWGNVLREFFERAKTLSEYKVVANLPYQITGKVIPLFLEADNPPKSMTIMVQKEVAQRMVAQKGDMSVLAVAVQYFGKVKIVAHVSAGSFFPAPKVDSAVVHISEITQKQDTQAFFALVKAGFAQKRKQVWKNIASAGYDGDKVKDALVTIGATQKARAQELSVDQWGRLLGELGEWGERGERGERGREG